MNPTGHHRHAAILPRSERSQGNVNTRSANVRQPARLFSGLCQCQWAWLSDSQLLPPLSTWENTSLTSCRPALEEERRSWGPSVIGSEGWGGWSDSVRSGAGLVSKVSSDDPLLKCSHIECLLFLYKTSSIKWPNIQEHQIAAMVESYSEISPVPCWQAMFLSPFIGCSWRGGGFLSTLHLCRPQHQPTDIPENDCHDSSHPKCLPAGETRFSSSSETFFFCTFSTELAFSDNFSSSDSFLQFELGILLLSPWSILLINLYLWRGWTGSIDNKEGRGAAWGWNSFASDASQTF